MALFEKVTILDSRGNEHVVQAGPFSRVEVEQGERSTCIAREDVFGFRKETTCIQNPPIVMDRGR